MQRRHPSPLTAAPVGTRGSIERIDHTHEIAMRLRELGVREGCSIRVVSPDPMIFQVNQTRVGLPRDLARCIMIAVAPA